MEGFTPIRNGIAEHLEQGRMTPLEFAVYMLLHLYANWETGICHTCALTLAHKFGDPKS